MNNGMALTSLQVKRDGRLTSIISTAFDNPSSLGRRCVPCKRSHDILRKLIFLYQANCIELKIIKNLKG